MVWKRGGSVREEGEAKLGRDRFAPTRTGISIPVTFDVGAQDDVCVPASLSFVALPLPIRSSSSSSSLQCPCPGIDASPAALPVVMDSLFPNPFSSSSLSSFFLARLAKHSCTASLSSSSSGLASSAVPSVSLPVFQWPRRDSEASAPSLNNVVRLSSLAALASLASSLPRFSTGEKAFVVETKDDLAVSRGVGDSRAGDGLPVIRNLMAGNARFRKEAAVFFKQLPSQLQGIRRRSYDRGPRRKGRESTFELALDADDEKKAERTREGKSKAVRTSQHLLAGALAAMVSRTIVAPLERLKLEYLVRGAKGDVVHTVKNIFHTEGVRGFWKGNVLNLLRTAPFKSVNFFAYDTYRRQLLKWGDRAEVTNIERLAAGAAAGVTATILCFPLDTIRTLVVAPGGEALGGLGGCFQHLMRTEGLGSLYRGLPAAVVSMAPSGAVFYGAYDMLKSAYLNSPEGKEMLRARQKRAEERPEENSTQLELGTVRTLLFGAIAGACAETVTYPLEVVRRAQQMQLVGNKLGMIGTIQALVRKGGVEALYAGILPSTLQVLPSAALSYFVYETMKVAFKIP